MGRIVVRSHRLIVLLLFALLTGGCMGWADAGGPRPGTIVGGARVAVGGAVFPLYGATVATSGATNAVTSTDRNGTYMLSRLREGRHQVQLRALHGVYSQSLHVANRERLDWLVKPSSINSNLFFELAALKRVWLDQYDRIHFDYGGELVRWEQTQISVFMDVQSAPYGLPSGVVHTYWQELKRWEQYLAHRYKFVETHDDRRADVVVRWVPPGWFGDQAAITRQVAQYYNGALKRVEIEIDVQWADFPGVWEHEVGHAMGLGYVSDKNSVMYPRLALTGPQRRTLSQHEAAHVRLMYDIPSGQRLAGGWGVWAADATLAGEDEFGARGVVGFDGFAADEPGAAGVILHGAAVDQDGSSGHGADEPGAGLFSAEEAPVSGTRERMLRLAPEELP